MKLFKDKRQQEAYTIIIGCGRLGAGIANELSGIGENVLIMDVSAESFKRLSASFGGLSVVGDGCNLDKLKEAKIETASSVIAVTNDDNTNLMVAQIAKEIFGVKQVIARLYDPEIEFIYKKLGISTICPSVLSAKEIDKLMDLFQKKEAIA